MKKISKKAWGLALACALSSFTLASEALAQTWPSQTIKVIAPISAGSPGDALLRVVTERLALQLGQPIVIENRPGANTIIGMEVAARAKPDGYTILFTSDASVVANPLLYAKLPYNPSRDFEPITLLGSWTQFLLVHESVPAKSLAELRALAKAAPGKLTYASSGNGSVQHINLEMFTRAAGIQVPHVPYKGVSQAYNDLLGGQVSLFILPDGFVADHVRSGRLRALAVAGVGQQDHSALFPSVPTYGEAGLPGFHPLSSWTALLAPAGTPKPIIARLHEEVVRAMRHPDVRAKLAAMAIEPAVSQSPAEFADFIRRQTVRWEHAIKETGIRIE